MINALILAVLGAVAGWATGRRVRRGDFTRDQEDPAAALHQVWPAAAVAGLWALTPLQDSLGGMLWMVSALLGVWAATVDLHVHRLPDRIQGPWAVLGVAILGGHALTGQLGWGSVGLAFLVAAAAGVVALALALVVPGGVGLGDVKLIALTGLLLGWAGWHPLLWAQVVAWVAAGIYATVYLLTGGKAKHQDIPMGPFLVLGLLVALQLVLRG